MKLMLLLLTFVCLRAHAQVMTTKEKELRKEANFKEFIREVKGNSRLGCLCNNNEFVVFSFRTKTQKIASLCVSKNVSGQAGYLVYRFGAKAKIELSFPVDTINSFSQFRFAHYNRGGGKQNAAMFVNSLHFTNGDFTYTLHDNWNSDGNHYSKGIIINNNRTQQSYSVNPIGKATGTLWYLVNKNLVPETDEL